MTRKVELIIFLNIESLYVTIQKSKLQRCDKILHIVSQNLQKLDFSILPFKLFHIIMIELAFCQIQEI